MPPRIATLSLPSRLLKERGSYLTPLATFPKCSPPHTSIAQAGPDTLRIVWNDGHTSVYPRARAAARLSLRALRRGARGPARCFASDTVPMDVKPLRITSVGRYALAFAMERRS